MPIQKSANWVEKQLLRMFHAGRPLIVRGYDFKHTADSWQIGHFWPLQSIRQRLHQCSRQPL